MEVEHLDGALAIELMTVASKEYGIWISAEVATSLNNTDESQLRRSLPLHSYLIDPDKINIDRLLSAPVQPFVFYRDQHLHVRPSPVIVSGDPDLELQHALKSKVAALRALQVRYPKELKGLVISDSAGPLILAWKLSVSATEPVSTALEASSTATGRKLNPLAPSFRPLRQAFEALRNTHRRDHGAQAFENGARTCHANDRPLRGDRHVDILVQKLHLSGQRQQGHGRPFIAGKMHRQSSVQPDGVNQGSESQLYLTAAVLPTRQMQRGCLFSAFSPAATSNGVSEAREASIPTPSTPSNAGYRPSQSSVDQPRCRPPVAFAPPRPHANGAALPKSFPFRNYGSLLNVNRNAPDDNLRGEITAWQQDLEWIGRLIPKPTDHMSNLKQRINRLRQVLDTREMEVAQA